MQVKTDEINELMQTNGSQFKQIKSQLSILERLVKDAEET
jgi:hypothetical protein